MVERQVRNLKVRGSIPLCSTEKGKPHSFPFSVELLILQRCAMLSLRLPARCFDCSAISLTLPGPLMRRLEAAWLPFFRGASPITALRAAQPPAAGSSVAVDL